MAYSVVRNRYRIESLIGRGAMSEVYLAYDMRRHVHVALKFLREDLAEDKALTARLAREAEALARLDHPNIVRFYSFEREGARAFIVLEYIAGTTLRRRLAEQDGPLSISEATHILRQVGAALQYAHSIGIVHRDIKPGNILLGPDGRAYVNDFGIARIIQAGATATTGIGTPAYMSPEQIRGGHIDYRADIYSLGVMLYEMVTGRRPFTGEEPGVSGTDTAERVRQAHLYLPPPDPRRWNGRLSEAMVRVIEKALAKDPAQRWNSVMEMVEAWEWAVQKEGAVVGRSSIGQPIPRSAVSPQARPVSGERASDARHPQIGYAVMVGVALLAFALAVGLFLSSGTRQDAPPSLPRSTDVSTALMRFSSSDVSTPALPTSTSTSAVQSAGGIVGAAIIPTNTPAVVLSPTKTATPTETSTPSPTYTPTASSTPTATPRSTNIPVQPPIGSTSTLIPITITYPEENAQFTDCRVRMQVRWALPVPYHLGASEYFVVYTRFPRDGYTWKDFQWTKGQEIDLPAYLCTEATEPHRLEVWVYLVRLMYGAGENDPFQPADRSIKLGEGGPRVFYWRPYSAPTWTPTGTRTTPAPSPTPSMPTPTPQPPTPTPSRPTPTPQSPSPTPEPTPAPRPPTATPEPPTPTPAPAPTIPELSTLPLAPASVGKELWIRKTC